jgi:hypothetical protein
MAGVGNNCNVQCSEIYPIQDGHIKQRVGILGSKGQFCAAFYHVHQWDFGKEKREHYCLDKTNCIIGQRITNEKPSVQAKTVVAVVKFEDENRVILYEARYKNCAPHKKHAEDFFKQDIENQNGALRKLVEGKKKGTITLYLTYQPCNMSIGTKNTNRDQSCCTILTTIYESILQQHTISLCVKAANTYRLTVKKDDANDRKEDEDKDEKVDNDTDKKDKNEKYRINAVRGIKRLMRIGVNVSGMTKADWDHLFSMTNPDVPGEYDARRQHLDESVKRTFTDIKAQLK